MRIATSYREDSGCGTAIAASHRDQKGYDVGTIGYVGPGVEIEDDIVRLRRRRLEFEGDAARRARPAEPRNRRRRTLLPARATLAVIAPWRQRSCLP